MQQDRDIKYGDASLRVREKFASKVRQDLNKNVPDSGMRFVKLTELIPNWETYLTEKQLESAKKYIQCLNAYEVDYQLRLNSGTTHQRLFGNKTSKGALGRLEQVYKSLEEKGYFEELRRKKEAAATKVENGQKKKSVLSPKTIQAVKELLSLIVDNPDYEKYITKSQAEKVFHFLRLRNFALTARYCNITQEALKRALIGQGGVLEKLREVKNRNTVSNWDEI